MRKFEISEEKVKELETGVAEWPYKYTSALLSFLQANLKPVEEEVVAEEALPDGD